MEAALKVRRFCGDRTNIRDGNGCGAGWKVTGWDVWDPVVGGD